ncbi:MAG: DUF6516 family protein [Desulfobacteraceae bacterium]|jgi:hypothetical protein|nr:DUF6516 family protein [Desulfobacteraceae bacterium]
MLHDILSQYLGDIEDSLRRLKSATVERYEEEVLTSSRANLRIRVRFLSGHLFEVNEAIVIEANQLKHLDYRYHFQDQQNNLIFRYDNTPHFPDLKSFPHHKHLKNKVEDSDEPLILDVINEAKLLAQ